MVIRPPLAALAADGVAQRDRARQRPGDRTASFNLKVGPGIAVVGDVVDTLGVMLLFLFAVYRYIARIRAGEVQSMGRVRALLLVVGLAWRLAAAIHALKSSRGASGRDATPDRVSRPVLGHSRTVRGLRWAISAASHSVR